MHMLSIYFHVFANNSVHDSTKDKPITVQYINEQLLTLKNVFSVTRVNYTVGNKIKKVSVTA